MGTKTEEQKAKAREYALQLHHRNRNLVLSAYGGVCVCCGVSELVFLTIDHIHGGGTQHRKQLGSSGALYRLLIKEGFPKEYQVLCQNCNFAKSHWPGGCPHGNL